MIKNAFGEKKGNISGRGYPPRPFISGKFSLPSYKIFPVRVKTDFVLFADDLEWGGTWINLDRGIRILTQVFISRNMLLFLRIEGL